MKTLVKNIRIPLEIVEPLKIQAVEFYKNNFKYKNN